MSPESQEELLLCSKEDPGAVSPAKFSCQLSKGFALAWPHKAKPKSPLGKMLPAHLLSIISTLKSSTPIMVISFQHSRSGS